MKKHILVALTLGVASQAYGAARAGTGGVGAEELDADLRAALALSEYAAAEARATGDDELNRALALSQLVATTDDMDADLRAALALSEYAAAEARATAGGGSHTLAYVPTEPAPMATITPAAGYPYGASAYTSGGGGGAAWSPVAAAAPAYTTATAAGSAGGSPSDRYEESAAHGGAGGGRSPAYATAAASDGPTDATTELRRQLEEAQKAILQGRADEMIANMDIVDAIRKNDRRAQKSAQQDLERAMIENAAAGAWSSAIQAAIEASEHLTACGATADTSTIRAAEQKLQKAMIVREAAETYYNAIRAEIEAADDCAAASEASAITVAREKLSAAKTARDAAKARFEAIQAEAAVAGGKA